MSKGRKILLSVLSAIGSVISLALIPLLDADPTTSVSVGSLFAAVSTLFGLSAAKPEEPK